MDVSFAFDLKKLAAVIPPSASESVAVPRNLADETVLDSCIPCATVENPAVINAAAAVSDELGVNARLDTTPTTASLATNFSIDLFTPVLSCTVSGITCVTPDPATVVGPISVNVDPLYVYSWLLVVSNQKSPSTALDGAVVELVGPPAGLNFVPV